MATNYPTSLDTFSNPSASDKTNNLTTPHATQHANANDAIKAVEAKVGTGASTPSAGKVLRASGTGTSTWGAVVNADVSASADIAMTKVQPNEFLAFTGSAKTNVTGDGTAYVVLFDSEIFDAGAAYNPATGIYTAPVTGSYQFSGEVSLADLTASHTFGWLEIITSKRTFRASRCNIGAIRDNGNVASLRFALTCDMDANDTCKVQVTVNNSTKVVDVEGNASIAISYFTGSQVG